MFSSHIYINRQLIIIFTKRRWAMRSWSESSALFQAPSQENTSGLKACMEASPVVMLHFGFFYPFEVSRNLFKHRSSCMVSSTTWSSEPVLHNMTSWTLILGPKYDHLKSVCRMETSELLEVQKCICIPWNIPQVLLPPLGLASIKRLRQSFQNVIRDLIFSGNQNALRCHRLGAQKWSCLTLRVASLCVCVL